MHVNLTVIQKEWDVYIVEVCLGGSVERSLVKDLVGKGYGIFMDIFSSVNLYKEILFDNIIYATVTLISRRRNFPPDLLLAAKLYLGKRGGVIW